MNDNKIKAELIKKKLEHSAIIDHLKEELITLDRSITDAEDRLSDKRSTIADLEASISFHNSDLAEKTMELDAAYDNISYSEAILSDMSNYKNELDREISHMVEDFSSSLVAPLSKMANITSRNSQPEFRITTDDELQFLKLRYPDAILVVESDGGQITTIDARTSKKKITPFKFYTQVKPMHGRHKAEVYSIDTVLEVINQYKPWSDQLDKELIVEQKFDGVRLQIHKKGDKIKAWTEDGGIVTKQLPTLMNNLKSSTHDFVIEGEIELFMDDKHQHRSITAGVIHTKDVHPDEQFIRLTTYDLLWLDGDDIHDKEFTERYNKMKFLDGIDNVKVSPQIITSSQKQLVTAIKKLATIPGSEGAMIKLPSYKYELDGTTRDMIKFKNELSMDVKIIKTHPVKGSTNTFNYDCVVGEDTFVGRTFNTNITSDTGIIKVAFVDLFQYTDPKTKAIHFRWVFPRVIESRGDKKTPDSIQTAKDIVKQLDTPIREKRLPKLDNVVGDNLLPATNDSLDNTISDANPYLMLPDANQKFPFIIHKHYRGMSSHLDLRINTEHKLGIDDPQYSVLGWTMLDSITGLVDEPINTITKAKEFDAKNIWKINWDTGIFKNHDQIKNITPEDTPGYKELSTDEERTQIESIKKSVHPKAWMTYKGVIDKPEPGEPVPAGATKEFPGVLTIIDSGTVEWGCQKSYYHEYFINGKHINGRLAFRLLEREPEYEKAGSKKFWWTCIQPEDQTPYVLSSRAIKKEWLPPKGHSALPESIRKTVPKELEFWNMSRKDALEARKELASRKTDCGCSSDKKTIDIDFKLQKQTWRGPMIIRETPTRTEYHLILKMPSKYTDFVSEDSPIETKSFTAIKETAPTLRWNTTGSISPKHKLNSTKATTSKIEVIDSGKVTLELDGDSQKMIFKIVGDKLEGDISAVRQGPKTNLWDIEVK